MQPGNAAVVAEEPSAAQQAFEQARTAALEIMRFAGAVARRGALVFVLGSTVLTAACTPARNGKEYGGDYYPTAGAAVTATLGHVAQLGESGDGCSALVLANHGMAVAALTAGHCVDLNPGRLDRTPRKNPDFGIWHTGADGQVYLVMPAEDQAVQVGPASNKMATVGTAEEILVPTNGDTDQALIVLAGHSETEALALYNEMRISDQEFARLKPGDLIDISGWPGKQDGDGQGNKLREDFVGKAGAMYLSTGTIKSETGKDIEVVWLAFPVVNGATCFYGISGSVAFTTQQTPDGYQPRLLGTVYGTDGATPSLDPTNPLAPQIVREHPGWFTNGQFASVCAIARTPLKSGDITPLHVVNDASQIPGVVPSAPAQSGASASTAASFWVLRRREGTA